MFEANEEVYPFRQSAYHPILWFVLKISRAERQPVVRLPDDSDPPDISVFGESISMWLHSLFKWMLSWPLDLAPCCGLCCNIC